MNHVYVINPIGISGPIVVIPSAVSKAILVPVSNGAPYTSGEVVGGIISLTSINSTSGQRVTLQSVNINDRANQKTPFDIYFFKSTPSGGTYTDNQPLVWAAGDSANKVGQIKVVTSDYLSDASQASVNYSGLSMEMSVSATTLFVLLIAQSTPTYATGDLTINMEFDLG